MHGPSSETLANDYAGNDFQALAVELWDGTEALVDNYRAQTGVTYPILMDGHTAGVNTAYDCEASFVFVIGADGIILYRGFFVDTDVRAAVDAGLAAIVPTAVPETPLVAHHFAGGYPNPFNPSTRLVFTLDAEAGPQPVRLEIADLQGRLLQVLVDETGTAGRRYETVWQGRDSQGRSLPSGVYLARLQVGDWHATQTLTLIK